MAMIICPECGKEVSDKAQTCPHCGCPITPTADSQEVNSKEKKAKKKDARLSLIACVIAGVAVICPLPVLYSSILAIAGLIIGLVDIGSGDKTVKHTGSWFAVVVAILYVVVMFL